MKGFFWFVGNIVNFRNIRQIRICLICLVLFIYFSGGSSEGLSEIYCEHNYPCSS